MKIKLAERLYLETEIPVYQVEYFIFSWKPFEHAKLKLRGYLGAHISWNQEVFRTCFYSIIGRTGRKNTGNLSWLCCCDELRNDRKVFSF